MLKKYHSKGTSKISSDETDLLKPAVALESSALIVNDAPHSVDDEAMKHRSSHQSVRLPNSEMLKKLPDQLCHLTEGQQSDVATLINRFLCLFSDVPTQTTAIHHDIEVNDARPIKQHPYRANPVKRAMMKKEAEYLLKNGLATHSSSPWSSPCLVEMKPDGSPRFITDFRKVNAVTVPDAYPLPRMEDCVDNIGAAKYVSKLDVLKGYWQVPLTDRASRISAFVTLALVLALQHFEVYVGSSILPVVVFTDHNPLVFLARMYNHNQRLMRWALIVQDYNIEIRHKKGSDNVLADTLSRA